LLTFSFVMVHQFSSRNLPASIISITCICLVLCSISAFSQTGIYINNDDPYTTNTKVRIDVKILDADSIIMSHDPAFPSAIWVKATKTLEWELLPTDGKKELYIKYKDKDGNVSRLIKERIILDTTPPKNGDIEINYGNNYVNFLDNVVIESEILGADWIMVSESPDFSLARWEAFYPKIKYSFKGSDGKRKIYVKFKDHAGNESEVFEDELTIDTAPPTDQKIEIIHGAIVLDSATGNKYLNEHNTIVDLKLFVKEGKYMKIANGGAFFGLKWRLYSDQHLDWELGNFKDGKYKVGVVYRDVAKNETRTVSDEIIVDTSPPFGERITISDNDFYTKTSEVSLKIAAVDANKMIISENKDFKGAKWEKFKTYKTWKFSEEDGEKRIYVKFMDIAENESNVTSDVIIKDKTPPVNGKIIINEGDKKTLFASAHAQVFAEGANFMQISNRSDFAGATWKSYHNNAVFVPLDKTPGMKKIYARFKDDAGNISEGISGEILLEVKPVAMKLAIDDDAVYCNKPNRTVQIHLFAKEAKEMKISNSPNFEGSNWEAYIERKEWVLSENEGEKRVYAKFRSNTQTESETVSDEIILDTSSPLAKEIVLNKGLPNTFNKKVAVRVLAQNAIYMQVSEDSTFANLPWSGYTNRHFYYVFHKFSGIHTLYARFKDEAGNISNTVSGKVKIQINPISIAIFIDNNATYCTHPERKVRLYIEARSATEMMLSNSENFSGQNWVPYKKEIDWVLEEGEGTKKVYLKLRSKTGIESDPKHDEIILDIDPPTNTNIKIDGGNERTTKPSIEVSLFAQGAISQQLSKYPDFKNAKWLPYNTNPLKYFIGNEGGTYTLYARFKDISGNISEAVSASIIKEIQPHNGVIQINNDEPYTTNMQGNVEVELLTVRATEMLLSESEDFSDANWQPIKKSVKWQLSNSDGVKSIYAKFRSSTLNESNTVKDEILLDRTPPQNCAVAFDNSVWLRYLNPNQIQVKLQAQDVYQVQISEYKNFTGRPWRAYTDKPFPFRVSNAEKNVTLFTRFKDFYGNISDTIVTPVEMDITPPENNTFIINEGALHTNNTSVTIHSYSEDAVEMRIANSQNTLKTAQWQSFSKSTPWQLDKGADNVKIVYVQYKDKQGNVSKTETKKVELDRTAPQNAILKVDGNIYCNHPGGEIRLKLKADGSTKMMIANDQGFTNSQWETYTTKKIWKLQEGDGKKDIFVKYGDEAGNESRVIHIEPVLDRIAPEAINMSINSDATLTNKSKVKLNLDASEAYEMIISNTNTFGLPAKWEPYSPNKTWLLKGQDGNKTVYVKFRDKAGNESSVLQKSISLDTEAPVIYTFEINKGETMVDGLDVELFLKVKYMDGLPDARYMQVSNTKDFSAASWETFNEQVSWRMRGNGLQKVYVRLKDEAGNISVPFSDNLTVY